MRTLWMLCTFIAMASFNHCACAEDSSAYAGSQGWFIRGGVGHLKVNTSSGEVTDVTGPVIKQSDVSQVFGPILGPIVAPALVKQDIGIPAGARADVSDATSAYLSVGKFLNEHWALEGLVLAVPFKHSVKGEGTIAKLGEIATVKQLPPTLLASYYFGNAESTLRPHVSLGVNYTRFFGAQATSALESYAGGPTDIKLSSSFGPAAFAGMQFKLSKKWHTNLQLGYVQVRTTATITTHDTKLTSKSPIIQDLPAPIPSLANSNITAPILDGVLNNLSQSRGGNLGTYERKLDLKLDPYVLLLSVGYAF